MYKTNILSVVLISLVTVGSLGESALADQSKTLAQLLDAFMLHRWSPAAATAVSDKISEMKEHGEAPDAATLSKVAALLESPEEKIAYAGATAVLALGHHARPIRMDVWKLYFRIVDEDIKICGVGPAGNPILFDQRCFNRAFNPDELRWRVCSDLASIGDIPSDQGAWSHCAGLSR